MELADLLDEIAEYLDDCSDVRDGSYGEQVPNRAMQLRHDLEPFLRHEKRRLAAVWVRLDRRELPGIVAGHGHRLG